MRFKQESKSSMDLRETFLDSLLMYLRIRDWAFEQMTPSAGEQTQSLSELYRNLYLSNALLSVDLVGEAFYGKNFRKPAYRTPYDRRIINAFHLLPGSPGNAPLSGVEIYTYIRELRNAVGNRETASTHTRCISQQDLYEPCPPVLNLEDGKIYRSPCRGMMELAQRTTLALNFIIYQELVDHRILCFDPPQLAKGKYSHFSRQNMLDHAGNVARRFNLKLESRDADLSTIKIDQLKIHLGLQSAM